MPLVDRADSTLVVVEEGPSRNGSTDEELLARLAPGTPVFPKETFSLVPEEGAVAAIRDSGRRTAVVGGVEDTTRTLRAAEERFGPPPLRL